MAQTYEHLLIDKRSDGVALVTINRPQKLNAFNAQTRKELANALTELGADPEVNAVVLTGAGERGFIAGQDLNEAKNFSTADDVSTWGDQFKETYLSILNLDKPIIAAVNGYSVGAGCQMACICDIRIASENARFGMAEIDDGIPCVVGTYVLWDLIGRGRAVETSLTGRMIAAQEALQWGLVSRVVPANQLVEVALEQARMLGSKPKTAMRMNKEWMRRMFVPGYLEAKVFAKEAHTVCFQTAEAKQAMEDFVAHKRDARAPTQ